MLRSCHAISPKQNLSTKRKKKKKESFPEKKKKKHFCPQKRTPPSSHFMGSRKLHWNFNLILTAVLKILLQYTLLFNGICSFHHLEFNSGWNALADPGPERGLVGLCFKPKVGGQGWGGGYSVSLVPPSGSTNEKGFWFCTYYVCTWMWK